MTSTNKPQEVDDGMEWLFFGTDSNGRTEESGKQNDALQACFRAWRTLTSGLPPEDVTKRLEDAVKSITFEELTPQSFRDAFSTLCPLAILAKPLLDNLKRYEPWDKLMPGVYDKRKFNMPWSRKIFLNPLITCLPLLRSRDVVERILEMNIPIPFIYPVPPELSGVNHSVGKQPCYTIPFSSLRNVIIPGKPFVLSIGTANSEGNGKSTFLNMCFQTNFEVNAKDAFHSNSADIMLDRLAMPLPYNVIDCHGILPQEVLQLISHICHIGLIHIMPDDIIEDKIDEVLQLMDMLSDIYVIILLLRDMDQRPRDSKQSHQLKQKLSQFKEEVDKWNREHITITVHILGMPKIQTGNQFTDNFHELLKDKLVPYLKELPEKNTLEGFYEDLEARLIEAHTKEADNLTINLMICTEQARTLSKELKLALGKAEKMIGNGDFVNTIFPLSKLNVLVEKEKYKLLTTSKENESVKESKRRECEIQLKITRLQAKMKVQGENKYQNLTELFVRTVVINNDIGNMDEFSKVVADFSRYTYTISTGDSTSSKVIRRPRGAPIPLSMENFWKEAMLMAADDTSRQSVSKLGQCLLRKGRPLEVINGDTLSMDSEFLYNVLGNAEKGNLIVCSVLGPQSSHKSTLLNYLFGCSFMVGAGRCTKGLFASLFTTEYEGAENLLVLDTEGLLSIEKKDAVFDKQMTLFALALSHIVLINVKGEMGTEMKNMLEVTMLCLKRLRVEFVKPKIFFILRDFVDLNKNRQHQAIHSVLNDIREVGDKIDYKLDVNEESFILLPTALTLTPRDQENVFEESPLNVDDDTISAQGHSAYVERNVIFSRQIKLLKTRLLLDTVAKVIQIQSSSNSFVNAEQWVAHAKTVWDAVQILGDLNTLKDYYDRNDLGRITQEIMKDVLEEKFMMEIRKEINQRLSILNEDLSTRLITTETLEKREHDFIHFVDHQRQPVYAEELEKTFADRVKDLRISEAMKKEYGGSLFKTLEKMCTTARQEFQSEIGSGFVQVAIQNAIQEIRKWIDAQVSESTNTNAVETNAVLIARFDREWTSTERRTQDILIKMQPSQEKVDQNLRNDFHTVVKSMPYLTVLNNLIGTRISNDLVLDMLLRLNPKSPSFRSDWYTVMEEYYITGWNIKSWKVDDVRRFCLSALERISKLFASIQEKDVKLWNSLAVQVTIIELDDIIKDLDDNSLGPLGRHFTPMFYSICHASFFTLFRQIIMEQHIQHTNKSLRRFAEQKESLKAAFIRMVMERFDDHKTSSSIAAFFAVEVSRKVTTEMDKAFLLNLKARVEMTAEQLVDKCEKLQSDDDIFLYMTKPSDILERTFNVHFDDGYRQLMEQTYRGKYRNRIDGEMKALRKELTKWKSWWSEPAAIEFLNQIAISVNAPDRTLPTTIYTSFAKYLHGIQPQRNCMDKLKQHIPPAPFIVLLSSQKKSPCSETDFSYLFAAIPQKQAIKDPSLFIDELIKNLDSEMQKNDFKEFKPDEYGVAQTRISLLEHAIGCRKSCPMCYAKCTEMTVGHQTHRTNVHRMTALSGLHTRGTEDFVYDICTSRQVHLKEWAISDESFLPFDKFMKKNYPDWSIPIVKDARIAIKNKIRWVKIRQRLCDYYGLEDNTPEDWLTLVERYCPVCMNTFGSYNQQCGDEVKTPCGHSICSPCLAQLKGRPEVERKCPQCRAKLPQA